MKIIVCIKQVPDTKGGVKFNPDGTLDRAAMLAIMNPDDKAGLEAALRIKDEMGAEVTVLTMGLPKADDVLREALAMGADNAILVTDRVLGESGLRSDHYRPSGHRRRYRSGGTADRGASGNPGNLLCGGYQDRRRFRSCKTSV